MTTPAAPGRLRSALERRRPRGLCRFRPARPRRVAASLAVLTGISLASFGTCALITAGPGPARSADVGTLPVSQGGGRTASAGASAPAPVRIRIPGIDLDKTLIHLQVRQDGHLGVPEGPQQVGWWSEGPRPGDPGAAIIVGHVDSRTGPAAFYNVSSLRPGDAITIDREDHSHLAFTVRALRQYDKEDFPDDQVYATAGAPALRLITCGGTYDKALHEYRDNIVVYATPADPQPAAPPSAASPSDVPDRSGN
ncbi:class F sortase [Streptomyces sp. So13.3]|uniref:class F sortase n=1 Tax=Streptomyces sp. So13.3 TaxID=2136173 RepID=UPI001FD3069F|nr:class F sortase [Streptomyces sp. So13.3]